MLDSHARQVVLGPVLTHLTLERLQRTQAIEERMFLTGISTAPEDFLLPGPDPDPDPLDGGGKFCAIC